jgi:hypothetical protein
MIGGGVLALGLMGSFYYQSTQIHHYHKLYDAAQITIGQRDQTIRNMTETQNSQTKTSDANVIKVIQIPEKVQPIINEIKTAPATGSCPVPTYSQEVTNAF